MEIIDTSVHANPNNPPVLEVLQGMVWVQFLHPSPLGSWHQVQLFRVLTASWHISAVQDISAWLPVTRCLALSFHIWTQRYIHRQKSPSFRSHRNQSREKIKTLQSVLGKQAGAAAGFAEPPTHLEHRPQRWGVPSWEAAAVGEVSLRLYRSNPHYKLQKQNRIYSGN